MKTLDYLGLDEKKVQRVVQGLSVLLADLQVYYLKSATVAIKCQFGS